MNKSQLVSAIKTVLAEGMPNLKKPTKFETQNDTPEMTKVRKKLHAIQDRLDQYDADVKAGKLTDPDKRKAVKNKITDDKQTIFAELQKLAKEAKDKKKDEKKQKLDENSVRALVREVLSEEVQDITVSLTTSEISAILDAIANSNIENNISKAGQMQGAGGKILANLAQATVKLQNAYYPNPQADLAEEVHGQSALHKIAKSCKSFQEFVQKATAHLEKTSKSTLKTSGTVSSSMKRNLKSIWDERNDDDYDTVDEQQINEEAYDTVRDVKSVLGHNPTQEDIEEYLGRSLDSDEMDAFGFQIAIGRRNGQPIYASKKPTRYPTYTRRRGDY
jgi:hypothetical protein